MLPGQHPTEDRDEVHDVYRSWRRIADSYEGTRVLVGEVWVPDAQRFAAYLRPDEMHTAFNFDFMSRPWDAAELRASIDLMLAAHAPVGAPSTWVLSNHDVTRPVTRYGREDSSFAFARKRFGTPTDVDLGRRRARAAALLTAALPGSLYLYQGDELGLPEVELPREVLEDPMHFRSGGVDPGRDGCRVPLPWRGAEAPFGFSPAAPGHDGTVAAHGCPQPAEWAALTVQAQEADPASMLWLYRQALRIRKREHSLGDGTSPRLPSEPTALVFQRGDDLVNVTNLGTAPMALPDHDRILLSSTPLVGGMLPPTPRPGSTDPPDRRGRGPHHAAAITLTTPAPRTAPKGLDNEVTENSRDRRPRRIRDGGRSPPAARAAEATAARPSSASRPSRPAPTPPPTTRSPSRRRSSRRTPTSTSSGSSTSGRGPPSPCSSPAAASPTSSPCRSPTPRRCSRTASSWT